MLAVIAAERRWINEFIDANMADAEAARTKQEFSDAMEVVETNWQMRGEKNPDDPEFNPAEKDSDDDTDDENED